MPAAFLLEWIGGAAVVAGPIRPQPGNYSFRASVSCILKTNLTVRRVSRQARCRAKNWGLYMKLKSGWQL